MPDSFLKERLDRVIHLITENFKIAEDYKKGPKGPTITIEKDKGVIAPEPLTKNI
jgi:hypothetical protein